MAEKSNRATSIGVSSASARGPPASLNRRPARFRPATLYHNVGGIAFGDPASLIVFPWATGLTLAWHFWYGCDRDCFLDTRLVEAFGHPVAIG